jgi:nitrite reductase/ring-hydroxylating ferredoxin subunit
LPDPDLVFVCELRDIPAGEARAFDVEGYSLAIFNTGEEVLAIDKACPHMGTSLAEGEMSGSTVCCREHGWVIDLRDGDAMGRNWAQAATYPIEVRDEKIYVQLG